MAATQDNNKEHSFKEAFRQFVEAQLFGQEPDIEELVKNYPEFEDQIRQKLERFRKVDSLFGSIVRADESDFDDPSAGHDLVGRKIGNFEITEMIGQGGMGVVYLARDTKLKRSVAIKSIPAALAADSTAQKRFRREAELLASLNHPNIAVIHDILEEDKSGYLILEYVPGETLAERIVREPPTLEEALSIGRQVAEAISAAHEKGIVHRDLKPSNIKITPDGRIKVLDFGLAKVASVEGKSGDITETQTNQVIGTPAYMSPEQIRGGPIDRRTDIWSFGCVLYQMLTGKRPFEANTVSDTVARIIERQPDWQALPQKTPANIRVLLRRCLEKDSDHRLEDIEDTAKEIRETLSKSAMTPTAKLLRIAMIVGTAIIIVGLYGLAQLFTSNGQSLTENAQAYEYYQRGREYFGRDSSETNLELTIGMFEKAIALDPNFTMVYALLSGAHSQMYWFKHDNSEARLVMAKEAVDKAFELDPDLPEAHHALGCYYYWGYLDYDRALEEFETALRSMPNSIAILAKIAYVYRRQGEMEKAKATLEKAICLNPLDSGLLHNQGQTLILLRKYPEALSYFNRAIAGRPDYPDPYDWKAQLYVCWKGNTVEARKVLEEASKYVNITKEDSILLKWILFDIFDEKYQTALNRLSIDSSEVFETEFVFIPKALLYAQIHSLMGNQQLGQTYYDSARNLLESRIADDPNNAQFHSKLGIAYAGLGRKEDAISEGKRAVQLLPVGKEAWQGLYLVEDLAKIYVMVGEFIAAIDQLEILLIRPGELSKPFLQLDPAWNPLRNHPRFQQLLKSAD